MLRAENSVLNLMVVPFVDFRDVLLVINDAFYVEVIVALSKNHVNPTQTRKNSYI